MVFIQRNIPTAADLSPLSDEEAANHHEEKLFNKTSYANLVGLLKQIALLSEHATDIFSNLLIESSNTANKITNLNQRIHVLENSIPSVQKAFQVNGLEVMNKMQNIDFSISMQEREQLFFCRN